jgi:serine protease AprX
MKNNLLALLFLMGFQTAFGQTSKTTFWITFKDKSHTPYSITDPAKFLSERSIDRRKKQNISIKESDLPIDPLYIKEIEKHGAAIVSRSKWFNAISVTLTDETEAAKILTLPFVKSVKKIEFNPDVKSKSKFDLETSEVVPDQKELLQSNDTQSYNYGLSYSQVHMIDADCMHKKGYAGQGIVIAQLDAGFYHVNELPAFDSLWINHQILGCRDFSTGDTLVFEDDAHGMSVLSCMGGNLPGKIIGTAPKAKFWLLRTEVAATESIQEEINWAVAAEFADSVGADIINSSLGYSEFDDASTNHTYADMDGNTTIVTKAADWAASVGIFVCSSAGNSGGNPWHYITAPADADSVLTVGAVDSLKSIVYFSSRGPTSDGRIKPNTVAQGAHCTFAASAGGVTFGNGTSFSSPITAGAVACLWQANPTRTNMQIMYAIEQSCSQSVTPDNDMGFGVPNFCIANVFLAGINEQNANEEKLNVYPNPFNSNVEINFYSLEKQTALVELYDISGRKISVFEKTMEMNTENKFMVKGADQLSKGIYILRIKTSDKIFTEKIVKQ